MTNALYTDNPIIDGQFKDNSPLGTVARIKEILQQNGIETYEVWHETNVPYCYAVSIKIDGTTFSVNGKGLTKEFTMASGYGELMERLQMGFVNGPNVLKDGDFAIDNGRYEMMPAAELIQKNRGWYERMAQGLHHFTGVTMTPEQIVSQYADANGMVSVTPYYNLTTGENAYLPTIIRKRAYSTNGCAAGNSPEEAIVQALSEIVERTHRSRIVEEDLPMPEIPEAVLQKYKIAYDIIKYVRSQGFRVFVKDASLGTDFPVVCVCIIDEKTGRYHTHFGAYPVLEIALERSLTESFQGRNIRNIAKFEDFSTRKTGSFDLSAFTNELNLGTWMKRPGFFMRKSNQSFNPEIGFKGGNNKELLRQCRDYFTAMGYDILVRDRSCLGFPTYQVVVPGYSESNINRLNRQLDDHRYSPFATKTLRDPVSADPQDMLGLLMHLEQMSQYSANISGVHGFLMGAKIPAKLPKDQENHLMSAALGYVYYTLGRRAEVIKCIAAMLPTASEEDVPYLICLKRYLSLLQNKYSITQIRQVIEFFHQPETVQKLYGFIETGRNPLEPFVLRCDKKCAEDCKLYGACCKKRVQELSDLLEEKMQELPFEGLADALKDVL